MLEVIKKYYEDLDENILVCVVKDTETNRMYLKKSDEMLEISYSTRYSCDDYNIIIVFQDSKYKWLWEGDLVEQGISESLQDFALIGEPINGIQAISCGFEANFFVKTDGSGVLNKYIFWDIKEFRGEFAYVNIGDGQEYGVFYLGKNEPLVYNLFEEISDNRYFFSDYWSQSEEPFIVFEDDFNNFGSRLVYLDIFGNYSASETQLGVDGYKYKIGEISVYDLNKEYFKDSKVVKFVIKHEKECLRDKLEQAKSEDEVKKIRLEALKFNSFIDSIELVKKWKEQEAETKRKKEQEEALKKQKEECEEFINGL